MLGPTLFALYAGHLPEAVSSTSLYTCMYADDTTIYCIGESVDSVTNTLNNALKELEDWSSKNNLVPHPKKCEAMMLLQGSFTGLLNAHTVQSHHKMGDPHRSSSQMSLSIAYKELFPALLAASLWGHQSSMKRVEFCFDDTAVVEVLRYSTSRDSNMMMFLSPVHVYARHVTGSSNSVTDALSPLI